MSQGLPRYRRLLLDMHIPDWDDAFLSAYDPRGVVDRVVACGADSVMVSCQSHLGLCYWPTTSGRAHAAMKDGDWLGETIAGLRIAGTEVFGYYSVIFNNEAYLNHPDWRMVPRPAMAGGGFQGARYGHVCPNNLEYRQFVAAQIAELFAGYRFDGFFFDMTFWPGICECGSCRKRFADETGNEIPQIVQWSDSVWCAFQAARERWMVEFSGFLTGLVKQSSPVPVYHNFAVSLFNWTRGSSFDLARHCDFLGGDFYGDREEQFLMSRFMLNLSKERPIEFMTSRCVHLTDHVNTKSRGQLEIQALASLTSSGAFRLIDAIDPVGTVSDETYSLLGSAFKRIAPFQPYLGGDPVEDVAVYLSDHSKMSPAEDGKHMQDPALRFSPSAHLTAARGAMSRLREEKIAVGAITRRQLDSLTSYKVLILSEATRLSFDEVDAFTDYVERGGNLYISGACGTHTLEGRSADFLLRDCMGLGHVETFAGETIYFRPTDPDLGSLLRPQRLVGLHEKVQQVEIRSPNVQTLACITLPYGYPHGGTIDDRHWASIHSSPPGDDTQFPAITLHRYGRGKVVYSSAPLERSPHHSGRQSFRWLIDLLLEGRASFGARTFDHVWLTAFHQVHHKRFIVHLLNYPAELPAISVHDIHLTFGRGLDFKFSSLLELPDNREIAFAADVDGRFSAVIQELRDYKMLALHYE